jgi:hypothetical protein
MTTVNQTIVQAINSRRTLRFVYNGRERTVEPQCYGIGTRGTELLRGYQLAGGSQPEPLFDVAKISGLVLLDKHFSAAGPHYKRNDSALARIFAQL